MVEEDLAAIEIRPHPSGCRRGGVFEPFCAVFGANGADGVRSFVRERNEKYFTMEELLEAQLEPAPSSVPYGRFTAAPLDPDDEPSPEDKDAEVKTTAFNFSAGIFLLGVANDRAFRIRGRNLDEIVYSTRGALIGVNSDYQQARFVADTRAQCGAQAADRLRRLLAIERQGALVHEARHSDCTGGIDRETIRCARNQRDPLGPCDSGNSECSHPHSICRSGVYRGHPACERKPWGSYSVQLVFLREAAKQLAPGSADARFLRDLIVDLRLRYEPDTFDVDAMLRGDLGPPDLTHDERADLGGGAYARGHS